MDYLSSAFCMDGVSLSKKFVFLKTLFEKLLIVSIFISVQTETPTIYVHKKSGGGIVCITFCKMGKNKKRRSFLLLCSTYNIDTMCIIKSYFSSPLKKALPPLLTPS